MQKQEQVNQTIAGRLHQLVDMLPRQRQVSLLKELEGEMPAEKRRFPREALNIAVDYTANDRIYRDFIKDLSAEGVFVETRRHLTIGQHVVLAFALPESQIPIKFVGEVVRSTADGAGVKLKWQDNH